MAPSALKYAPNRCACGVAGASGKRQEKHPDELGNFVGAEFLECRRHVVGLVDKGGRKTKENGD